MTAFSFALWANSTDFNGTKQVYKRENQGRQIKNGGGGGGGNKQNWGEGGSINRTATGLNLTLCKYRQVLIYRLYSSLRRIQEPANNKFFNCWYNG